MGWLELTSARHPIAADAPRPKPRAVIDDGTRKVGIPLHFDSRLPLDHLQAFMNREVPVSSQPSTNRARGECFHRSAALLIDAPAWELRIGTRSGATEEAFRANSKISPTDYIHCWIEFNDIAIDPSFIENDGYNLLEYDKVIYREGIGARDIYLLKGRRVEQLCRAHGWDRRFLHGLPFDDDSLVRTLLTEADVPYEISPRGGVVPPGMVMPKYAQ